MTGTEQKRILVTGATGFVGRHLLAYLSTQACQVTVLCKPDDPLRCVLPPEARTGTADLADAPAVATFLEEVQPDLVFHLAGLVRGDNLQQLLAVNVLGTGHLLQAAANLPHPPRVVLPGSAAEVGQLDDPAVGADTPLRPLSAYGVSKAAQVLLGQTYARQGRVPVVVGRIFNITGPGEPATMLCGGMAAQIAACEAEELPPLLHVGNLSPTRDYLDVRDAAVALWLLGWHGRPGAVHNICSGQEQRVADVVQQLVACASQPVTLVPDPARQRPSDIPRCVGVPDPWLAAAGWKPTIPLRHSLADTLAWWRAAHHLGPTAPIG